MNNNGVNDMEITKKDMALPTLFGIRDRIDTNPDYQRPAVWSKAQKQLLIDTIVRGYDVPKIYLRKISSDPTKYEVIDGQQRLRAIWEFMEGNWGFPKDSDPIRGLDIANTRYTNSDNLLPDDLRMDYDTYSFVCMIVSESDEDEVREMFLRLQNGTTLKAQEKRNAMPGNMRDFIKELTIHPFFEESVNFKNSRYNHDLVLSQLALLELTGEPTNVKNKDLNNMYMEQKEFNKSSDKARKINRTLDYLHKCFPEKTPELTRYSVISLYTIASKLLDNYVVKDFHEDFHSWFVEFEQWRKEEVQKGDEFGDSKAITYHHKTQHTTDSEDSIKWRQAYLLEKLFEKYPDILLKDDQRIFTQEQRVVIWRRDKGICQVRLKCEGDKCDWDNWEADHKIPHSSGGKTTVSNGQVACIPCNRAKGAR